MSEIRKLLEEASRELQALSWEGTFEEYLGMAIASPELARHAHARVHDMIRWAGTAPGPEGVPRYGLFAGEIFGLDRALDRLANYFRAASTSPEVRRRILLLMGPPASGKSSIVDLLKRGLERYSRTEQGAMYAIKGCPMQEEPLHLVPEDRRPELEREHGLRIDGDLCPRCRYGLRREYGGDIGRMKVQRIYFSQSEGVGLGSFVATAPESQDIARLVGSVDLSGPTGDRLEWAGTGLRLDGELEAANRGIMEFIEIFKSDERFLSVMLGVTQEQVIKLGSIGSVPADEVVIAHSNEEEYNAFARSGETAAFLDRLILVRVPYNLRVSDEVRIYSKLLRHHPHRAADDAEDHVRIAPLTLNVAAVLSVLSRLEVPGRHSGLPRVSLLDKMVLYDGEMLPSYSEEDVERLREGAPREGMYGISPRYVINRLADAMARGRGCLTPLKALESLAEGLSERAGVTREERDRLLGLVRDTVSQYKELAVREVRRAATEQFHEKATEMFQAYVGELSGVAGDGAALTVSHDETTLRRVEGALNLKDADRPRFRNVVNRGYRRLRESLGSTELGHGSIPALKPAVENLLFPRKDEVKVAIDPRRRDEQGIVARRMIIQRLISEHGYCAECSEDLVRFAWSTLSGKEVITVKRGRVVWE